ncbi:HAD hydrolase-like protein [Daejeonella sp.]|uniref:HAD hydrolase-like protein n=1 Tax=Daejeonella sp. TaxID=2805397 RepID=UPI0025BE0F05|nr:HAD hydrolase-like protein [Daejeonella sp.]
MLTYKDLDPSKKAFIFGLDNVLYPEQDYLLQVYYLFANFIEFTEGFPPASDLTEFCKKSYLHHGDGGIFDRIKQAFGIEEKYRENFTRLYKTARLPLKLILYPNVLSLLQDIIVDRKAIIILTNGIPEIQINKIMQTEWNGLEKYLKVYYVQEIVPKLASNPITYILEKEDLQNHDVSIINCEESDKEFTQSTDIEYLNINEFI